MTCRPGCGRGLPVLRSNPEHRVRVVRALLRIPQSRRQRRKPEARVPSWRREEPVPAPRPWFRCCAGQPATVRQKATVARRPPPQRAQKEPAEGFPGQIAPAERPGVWPSWWSCSVGQRLQIPPTSSLSPRTHPSRWPGCSRSPARHPGSSRTSRRRGRSLWRAACRGPSANAAPPAQSESGCPLPSQCFLRDHSPGSPTFEPAGCRPRRRRRSRPTRGPAGT